MKYKEEHGNCLVRTQNFGLGNWVHTQRREYKKWKLITGRKKSSMTDERYKKLVDIGFVFNVPDYLNNNKNNNSRSDNIPPYDNQVVINNDNGNHRNNNNDGDIHIPPEVGERVYSRFTDGCWYWGKVTKKYLKDGEWCFSILYDDGDFVEELKTEDGIATVAQVYGNNKSVTESSSKSSDSVINNNLRRPDIISSPSPTGIANDNINGSSSSPVGLNQKPQHDDGIITPTSQSTETCRMESTSQTTTTTTTTTGSNVHMMETWTNETKTHWKRQHPCIGVTGQVLKAGHKQRNCKHCGSCPTCHAPPWCNEPQSHSRSVLPNHSSSFEVAASISRDDPGPMKVGTGDENRGSERGDKGANLALAACEDSARAATSSPEIIKRIESHLDENNYWISRNQTRGEAKLPNTTSSPGDDDSGSQHPKENGQNLNVGKFPGRDSSPVEAATSATFLAHKDATTMDEMKMLNKKVISEKNFPAEDKQPSGKDSEPILTKSDWVEHFEWWLNNESGVKRDVTKERCLKYFRYLMSGKGVPYSTSELRDHPMDIDFENRRSFKSTKEFLEHDFKKMYHDEAETHEDKYFFRLTLEKMKSYQVYLRNNENVNLSSPQPSSLNQDQNQNQTLDESNIRLAVRSPIENAKLSHPNVAQPRINGNEDPRGDYDETMVTADTVLESHSKLEFHLGTTSNPKYKMPQHQGRIAAIENRPSATSATTAVKSDGAPTPEVVVGDRVYTRYSDGHWYWGEVTKAYFNRKNNLCYSILYDNGNFMETFFAAHSGILTEAQYKIKFGSEPQSMELNQSLTQQQQQQMDESIDCRTEAQYKIKFSPEPQSMEPNKSSTQQQQQMNESLYCGTIARTCSSAGRRIRKRPAAKSLVRGYRSTRAKPQAQQTPPAATKTTTSNGSMLQNDRMVNDQDKEQRASSQSNVALPTVSPPINLDQNTAETIDATNAVKGGETNKDTAHSIRSIPLSVCDNSSGTWSVDLCYHGRSRIIGSFDTKEKAALASKVARENLLHLAKVASGEGNLAASGIEAHILSAKEAALDAVKDIGVHAERATVDGVNVSEGNANSTSTIPTPPKADAAPYHHILSKKDVILERGDGIDSFPGNHYYRQLLDTYKNKHAIPNCVDAQCKSAMGVIEQIHQEGGRFVKLLNKSSTPLEGQPCAVIPNERVKKFLILKLPTEQTAANSAKTLGADSYCPPDRTSPTVHDLKKADAAFNNANNRFEMDEGIPGRQFTIVPNDFPFFQQNDHTWYCKFCTHEHPDDREQYSVWNQRGPPPHSFIEYHLNVCRHNRRSTPSPLPPPPPRYCNHAFGRQYMQPNNYPPGPWDGKNLQFGSIQPGQEQGRGRGHVYQPQSGIPPHRYPPSHFDSQRNNIHTCPNGRTAMTQFGTTSGGSTADNLLSFLQGHESSLKDTASSFHQFLISQDIVSLADLSDACDDDEYRPKLINAGIKVFRIGPFVKAVKDAIG